MKRRILAAVTASILAVSLAACSQDKNNDTKSEDTDEPTVALTSEGMPTIKEDPEMGQPMLVFPKGSKAPEGITVSVLEEGTGRTIERTDMVSADYVGAVWGSEQAFDSSFKRDAPLTMSLTQLVPGWGYGLEGQKVGVKLILSIPPEYGYGESGQPDAGIGGTDTIVFYIHVLDAWGLDASGQADATVEMSEADLPVTIDAKLGEPVRSISVKDGVPLPTEPQFYVVARGTGDVVGEASTVYYQAAEVTWDNSSRITTWGDKPEAAIGAQTLAMGAGSNLDGLVGIPAGSRVCILIPGEDASSAAAAIVDIIAVSN